MVPSRKVRDELLIAGIPGAQLEVAVLQSTALCRHATLAHQLAVTPSIALGRLLTSLALVNGGPDRRPFMSAQLLTPSTLGQVYGDINFDRELRGYCKNPKVALPLFPGESASGRRTLRPAFPRGKVSVIRAAHQGGYAQSSISIAAGEVDLDLEAFLESSDQVSSVLHCDVLFDAAGEEIEVAGGIWVRALPDGDRARLEALRQRLHGAAFVEALRRPGAGARGLLEGLIPDAVVVDQPTAPIWRCRCSKDRVRQSLRMFGPEDLAELVEAGEGVTVDCDLCRTAYHLSHAEVLAAFTQTLRAQA